MVVETMRTFDEAVELITGLPDDVREFGDRHQDFMFDILANQQIAFLAGRMIRARLPAVGSDPNQFEAAVKLCVDMLFTGLCLGMAMRGDDEPH